MQKQVFGIGTAILVSGILAVGIGLLTNQAQSTKRSFRSFKQTNLQKPLQKAETSTRKASDLAIAPTTALSNHPQRLGTSFPGIPTPQLNLTSAWTDGYLPGTPSQVEIASGNLKNKPQIGVIWIFGLDKIPPGLKHSSTTVGPVPGMFDTPKPIGPVTITAIHGVIATWTAQHGIRGTFNLHTHLWSTQKSS